MARARRGRRREGALTRRRWALGATAAFFALLTRCQRDGVREGAPAGSASSSVGGAARIVAVGGTVTEIVYALGAGPHVVAVDTSSVHPKDATTLPQVGYQRTLAAEGIAAQRPTLLLLSAEAGPPPAIEQLRALGVPIEIVPARASADGVREKIQRVARALGAEARGEELARTLSAELDEAAALARRASTRPRVLFVYARGAGTLMVGGSGTPADAMIRLAACENAVTAFEGFKPLTAEAVTTAAPDAILIPERGLASVGGVDGLLAQPGLALTPAGKAKRVVSMDDLLLLGFGPRLGRAVRELATRLHPELREAKP